MIDPAKHDSFLDTLKLHQKIFHLVPELLEQESKDIESLVWEEVRFTASNGVNVPDERGLYAFTVHSSKLGLPIHGYVMYIGIAGNTSSNTLRKRFSNYINAQKTTLVKRPKVREMLKRWGPVLYFQYTSVQNEGTDLHDLEKKLNDIFQSPCVSNDFTATVRSARKAF